MNHTRNDNHSVPIDNPCHIQGYLTAEFKVDYQTKAIGKALCPKAVLGSTVEGNLPGHLQCCHAGQAAHMTNVQRGHWQALAASSTGNAYCKADF
jgi:hypothetical protein